MTKLASSKGGGGNWRTSIVDLLKVLDLDSSFTARKDIAQELSVSAGADGSAEQNIALSKAVMQRTAGKSPTASRTDCLPQCGAAYKMLRLQKQLALLLFNSSALRALHRRRPWVLFGRLLLGLSQA